jgi:tRNA(Ile)-lysidine synthase
MKNKIIDSIKNLQSHKKQHFLLAVSGGIDSMVMLDFFNRNSNLADISVCHVNHNYHSDSEKMSALVSTYCNDNNIPYIESSIDSSEIKSNIEAQLREKRYLELIKVCKKVNADHVVTAHHAADQIETILMKILNSSSFSSMRGIQSLNNNIFRPMLSITKDEIIEYAKKNKVVYISDPTNEDTVLTRNFLRKKVIPLLENIKPNLYKPFEDFQNKTNDVEDLLSFTTNEFIKSDDISLSQDIYYINKKRFLALPFLLRISIIKKILSNKVEFYFSKNLLVELSAFLEKEVIGSEKMINNAKILIDRDYILLTEKLDVISIYREVKAGEVVENDEFSFYWDYDKRPKHFLKDSTFEYVDAERFNNTLVVRNVDNDDVFSPLGLSGTKKVSQYLTDQKVSAFEKRKTIAICNEKDIVWVAGKQISNNYKLTKNSKLIAKLNFFRK